MFSELEEYRRQFGGRGRCHLICDGRGVRRRNHFHDHLSLSLLPLVVRTSSHNIARPAGASYSKS